jgi:hypothetical protein
MGVSARDVVVSIEAEVEEDSRRVGDSVVTLSEVKGVSD